MDGFAAKRGITRRTTLRAGGLALVTAGLALGNRAGVGVLAQATPESDLGAGGTSLEGRFVDVRLRDLKPDQDAATIVAAIRDGFVPLIQAVPGFVGYLGVFDPASPRSAFLNIFADASGAAATNEIAAAWLQENNYDWFTGDPSIARGEIAVAAGTWFGQPGATPTSRDVGATPSAGDLLGLHAAVRVRTLKPDASGDDLATLIRDGFVPLVEAIPGFVAYLAVADSATGSQIAAGLYADAAGPAESTRAAAEWGSQGANDFVTGDPAVVEGIVEIAVS